jgi:predicted nuclease of predicted toxin-antitoxin system
MNFLANENFPMASIHIMRKAGFDVAAIIETSPGITDSEVLHMARQENRVILTFDRDYGELIYKSNRPTPKGVVYFRFLPSTPAEPGRKVLQLIEKKFPLDNNFTVLERDRLRQRPLPPSS